MAKSKKRTVKNWQNFQPAMVHFINNCIFFHSQSICSTGIGTENGIGPVSAISRDSILALIKTTGEGVEEDNKVGSGDQNYSEQWYILFMCRFGKELKSYFAGTLFSTRIPS